MLRSRWALENLGDARGASLYSSPIMPQRFRSVSLTSEPRLERALDLFREGSGSDVSDPRPAPTIGADTDESQIHRGHAHNVESPRGIN